MTNEQMVSMTRADFQSLSEKLEQFGRSLPAGERDALGVLLQQAMIAASGDSEVSGYDMGRIPIPDGDLLHAFGLS